MDALRGIARRMVLAALIGGLCGMFQLVTKAHANLSIIVIRSIDGPSDHVFVTVVEDAIRVALQSGAMAGHQVEFIPISAAWMYSGATGLRL